jgi:hypothetical protein
MTTKHKSGPWFLSGQYVQIDADGGIIARVHGSNAECKANARLIAAAPELLEALKELRQYADLKLQGHRQDYPEDHCMVQTALRMIAVADAAISKAINP